MSCRFVRTCIFIPVPLFPRSSTPFVSPICRLSGLFPQNHRVTSGDVIIARRKKAKGERNEGSGVNRIEALNILGLDDDATAQTSKPPTKNACRSSTPTASRAIKSFRNARPSNSTPSGCLRIPRSGRGSKETPGSARSSRSFPTRKRSSPVSLPPGRNSSPSATPCMMNAATPSS